MSEKDLSKRIKLLEKQMLEHANNLEFEKAARVRDQLAALREQAFGAGGARQRAAHSGRPARTPRSGAIGRALEAELINAISTELVGFRYT